MNDGNLKYQWDSFILLLAEMKMTLLSSFSFDLIHIIRGLINGVAKHMKFVVIVEFFNIFV